MSPVGHRLVIRRVVPAPPQRVFAAWTTGAELLRWWGPTDVRCIGAEVDLSVGGRYRLDHERPDGTTITVEGIFIEVEPPHRLAYSWSFRPDQPHDEVVTVCFHAHDGGTEVEIVHERIVDLATAREHERGWLGCLDGLLAHCSSSPTG